MHGLLPPSSSDESVKLAQADELATKANSKLVREAKQPEHCLLRLVLTANLIDGTIRLPCCSTSTLTLILRADLNEEMESLKLRVQPPPLAFQKVRWADRVIEDIEALHDEDDACSDHNSSDPGSDSDAEPEEVITPPPLMADHQMCVEVADGTLDDEDCGEMFADLEAAEDLALKRCPSGSSQSPVGQLDKQTQVVVVEVQADLAEVAAG